jgi:hypothetical protein
VGGDRMSVTITHCPDCRTQLWISHDWDLDDGCLTRRVAAVLVDHAREMPILHPTLLPDQHLVWVAEP